MSAAQPHPALPEAPSAFLRAFLGVLALPFAPRILATLAIDSLTLAERLALAPFAVGWWL